jgi:micrococcal nuclease
MNFGPRPSQLWIFRARPLRPVDGDTVDLMMDLGRETYANQRVRLLGINCPERHGPTSVEGMAALAFTADWLNEASAYDSKWPVVIQTEKNDHFGRYLATVWRRSDDRCLNNDLLINGMAVPFMENRV